jgi:hypothetical protein|tara:strand:- start:61 stop:183 length:123 start_codon:yes stop_codon:yes gene_type:complete
MGSEQLDVQVAQVALHGDDGAFRLRPPWGDGLTMMVRFLE